MSPRALKDTIARSLRTYSDGTIGTKVCLRRLDNLARVAIAHRFVGMLVEVERSPNGVTIVQHGEIIAAALSVNGSAGVLIIRGRGDFVPTSISLATVDSITQMSASEWAALS
jgi:hypothetical protein